MKIPAYNRPIILRLCLVFVMAAGVAYLPNLGARAAIDLGSFAAKVDFSTGNNTYGVTSGDLDGDGKPDLVATNYYDNTVSVLRNTSTSGNLSFAAKVDFSTGGTHPMGVAIGDLDGDGKRDLVMVNYDSNTIAVLRNTSTSGNISFAARVLFGTGNLPLTVAVGDLDGDGRLDLAVSNILVHTLSVLRNTSTSGNISFAARVDFSAGLSPYGVAIGDLDGDGKPDLAVGNYNLGANTVSVLRNTSTSGSVSFAPRVAFSTGTYPEMIALSDLDGDGRIDMAAANNWSNSISVLRNTSTSGSISFAAKADIGAGNGPLTIAVGRLDGDTKPDMAVVNYSNNTVSVLRNTSTSGYVSFAPRVSFGTGTNPYGLAISDLDGDSRLDLAVGNFNSNTISVLLNTIDITAPTVIFGAGSIPPFDGATLTTSPSQLLVQFSENVLGDGSEHAANAKQNYLLVSPGSNGIFDTTVTSPAICDSGHVIGSDDERIDISSITYNATTFTATLNIDPLDSPLPGGQYRLYVCGAASIWDLGSNPLNGGSNTAVHFTVALVTPETGFAPDRVTALLPQTTSYSDLGDLWLEIPRLGVQIPIVGVPQSTDGTWDVSWLGRNAGWLNGSAFPTYAGNSVLTGHVFDAYGNPGPFARLNQMWYGDKVIVHAWGAQYVYEVREMMRVEPGATTAMLKHQDLPWVTLVTCRGYDVATDSYAYRVLVRAVLVEVK